MRNDLNVPNNNENSEVHQLLLLLDGRRGYEFAELRLVNDNKYTIGIRATIVTFVFTSYVHQVVIF